MRDADFEVLAKLLAERSGLVLTGDKTYLLESRLTPVARKRDLEKTSTSWLKRCGCVPRRRCCTKSRKR